MLYLSERMERFLDEVTVIDFIFDTSGLFGP